MKFSKPISSWKLIRHSRWDFLHQLTVQVVVSPRLTVAYNCCVSVLPTNARIDPTTQQLIDETCTCRYSIAPRPSACWNLSSHVLSKFFSRTNTALLTHLTKKIIKNTERGFNGDSRIVQNMEHNKSSNCIVVSCVVLLELTSKWNMFLCF